MLRHKRTKIFQEHSPSNRSSLNNAVNTETLRNTDKKADGSKKMPRPNFSQLIEQKTWENDQLRRELEQERERYRASYRARMYIAAEAGRVVESLQQALRNFEQLNKEIEKDITHG